MACSYGFIVLLVISVWLGYSHGRPRKSEDSPMIKRQPLPGCGKLDSRDTRQAPGCGKLDSRDTRQAPGCGKLDSRDTRQAPGCGKLESRDSRQARVNSTECNEVFRNRTGFITTPNFPRKYDNNEDCTYTIQPGNSTFQVDFFTCDCELEGPSPYCYWDYLQFGKNSTKRCGELGRRNYAANSTNSTVEVKFYSDYSVTRKGCRIAYGINTTVEQLRSTCGNISSNGSSSNFTTTSWNFTIPIWNFTFPSWNFTTSNGNSSNFTTPSWNYTFPFSNFTTSNGNSSNFTTPSWNFTIPISNFTNNGNSSNFTTPSWNFTFPISNFTNNQNSSNFTTPSWNFTTPISNFTSNGTSSNFTTPSGNFSTS